MKRRRLPGVSAAQWGIPTRDDHGEPVCRWCGSRVRPPRRTFCGDACVDEWRVRTDPSYVREQVFRRDRGRCRLCGLDLAAAERRWRRVRPPAHDRLARRRWHALRPRWEVDHIVPVADGGGACGLDNYRLLCRACHVAVTTAWRRARRAAAELQAEAHDGASTPARPRG